MFSATTTEIQNELNAREVLLWSGQPAGGIRFRAADLYLVPFSLLWCGFACFWEANALGLGGGFFALWGIPFVVIGNYFVWGRFLYDAWERNRSVYAVTNQRTLIISRLLNRKVKSFNLRTLTEITMEQKSDGSGTLIFGPLPSNQRYARNTWPGFNQTVQGFEFIPNVKEVYNMIQEAQRAA